MNNTDIVYFSVSFSILFMMMLYCLARIFWLQRKIYEKVFSGNKKTPTFQLTFLFNNQKIGGEITMFTLANNQLGRFVIGAPKDAEGEETTIEEGSLTVTSSNDEVFTVEQDDKDPENPMAKKIVAGRSGVAVLKIEADARKGEEVKLVTLEIAVTVTTGEAVGFAEPTLLIEDQQTEAPVS